jgi:superfamily II DNA/RNA helicase
LQDSINDYARIPLLTILPTFTQKSSNMPFISLGLSNVLLKTLADQNFTEPTPIQEKAIPAILVKRMF